MTRRLPIFGETSADFARREKWEDDSFGAWLFRKLGYPWFKVTARGHVMKGLTGEVFDLIDHVTDPYQVSPDEALEHLFVGMIQDERFADPALAGELEGWDEDSEDPELDPEMADPKRFDRLFFDEEFRGSEEAEWLLGQIDKWLGGVGHECTLELAPLSVPRSAGVYCIQGVGDYVKIGKARRIAERMKELQCSHPVPLRLLAVLSEDPADEGRFHRLFKAHRVHGEWFRLTDALRAQLCAARRGERLLEEGT